VKLTYGTYQHAVKTVTPRVTSVPLYTPRGEVYAIRQTVTIAGEVGGDDTHAVRDAVEELIAAYSTDGKDLVWSLMDDSQTPDVALISSRCIGGTRVIQRPSFTAGEGGEYSNYRKYEVVVQGDVRIKDQDIPRVWSYSQTIQRTGTGGPVYRHVPLKHERWQRQQSRRYSLVRIVQTGTIAGTHAHLRPPAPRWPHALLAESVTVTESEQPALWINGIGVGWETSWSYTFESATPLSGAP